MDKLLNKLDTNVCLKYNDTYSSVVGLFNFDISVLLNTIDNVYILYNNIRMNPALTEDIIVSIIKKLDRSQNSYINKCWLITQEFCEKYKSTSHTIYNIISKLKKIGVLIKDGTKIKTNPAICLSFNNDITLEIKLIYNG